MRLTVITDPDGTVVGTKQVVEPGDSLAPQFSYRPATQPGGEGPEVMIPVYSQIVAGPDQEAHVLDVDLPEQLFVSLDPAALHEIVQTRINQVRGREA
ncbi:hypothetical protein [Streptomyces sp. NBC_01006]|uniref:hypothetical protein n=1 Tax=Streptomyces sp. NBC_01006 TaxID=2903716 RepID=UPI0038657FFD|nr:hypothetical protein OG509_38610 [Streptomyces sp. NBC_01006]